MHMNHIIETFGILSIIKDVNYLIPGGFDLKGPINLASLHPGTFVLKKKSITTSIIVEVYNNSYYCLAMAEGENLMEPINGKWLELYHS